MTDKRPFAIDVAMARIREAIRPFPQAALFALSVEGFRSPFEVLVACLISIRTLDGVTLSCAHRLFALARTPLAMSQLTPEAIDDAIHACTFQQMGVNAGNAPNAAEIGTVDHFQHDTLANAQFCR